MNTFNPASLALIKEHKSLVQFQRVIKESINFAFTRSCNEGVVSYSFWAPQVRAAPMLRKTETWTTCPAKTGWEWLNSSPMAVAWAVESAPSKRETMDIHTPSSGPKSARKPRGQSCPRMP